MATSRTSTRARSKAREEVLTMLIDDHKRVRKAFKSFEKLDGEGDEAEALVRRTCAELEIHATLEEEMLYPAARGVSGEEDLIDEAEVEHGSAKVLIAQLRDMTPDSPKFAATFKVLGEYVQHHVKEEEGEMFPHLERAKLDWEDIATRMRTRRDELTQQLLPAADAAATGAAS